MPDQTTDLRKLNIDGTEYEVPADYTLMQACEEYGGAEIPRFCYHERLNTCQYPHQFGNRQKSAQRRDGISAD